MFSIYVHIPFCLSKCGYCSFNSRPPSGPVELETYCAALCREIDTSDALAEWGPEGLVSIYLGGGTPTVLPIERIAAIGEHLRRRLPAAAHGVEITVEANPGTVDAGKLSDLRAAGVNRLSLGVQSFGDRWLRLLGRRHSAAGAVAAFSLARAAGFDNIGIDLIFGLPGQTLSDWSAQLDQALRLGPDHVSLYSLSYEPGTEFLRLRDAGLLAPCGEEDVAALYEAAIDGLAAEGFEHYEISNFARPGRRSRHNVHYWRAGDYLGFGAGAHSHRRGRRWANVADPRRYAASAAQGKPERQLDESLSERQRLFEAVFLGLRMMEGIDIAEFTRRWQTDIFSLTPEPWRRLERNGLVETADGHVRLTRRGLLLADSVMAELAP